MSRQSKSSKLGVCYANQGLCYQHMGAYAKAIIYFEKARQIFTTTFDATHTNTLRVINSIGSNYFSLQEYDKAIAILEGLLQTELIQELEELTNLSKF
ncbi:MAG: tetratricopeptide repeat protein [Saprospiraceae bacterium]